MKNKLGQLRMKLGRQTSRGPSPFLIRRGWACVVRKGHLDAGESVMQVACSFSFKFTCAKPRRFEFLVRI